jgi:polyphosphate glucokinase
VDAPAPGPLTLSIDVGGTGLKASVLDGSGALCAEPVRAPTTYPMGPDQMVEALARLVAALPRPDRVSVGFPGMVRGGRILSAPKFNTVAGPETEIDPDLDAAWRTFDLADALEARLGHPTRVANDADVQGAAVVAGHGLELVVTLGTGVGTAVFADGHLAPHLELAHQPFRRGETYDQQIGDAARHSVGNRRWNTRVAEAMANFDALLFPDHVFIGGGNARHVDLDRLGLVGKVTVVDETAGILGGYRLWVPAGGSTTQREVSGT